MSGQDGAYLAQFLLGKGYAVFGSSRDAHASTFPNLYKLGIFDRVVKESISPTDFRSVLQAITRIEPDEIYNLSGQSSVGLSFEQPVETLESIAIGTLNFLEAIRSFRVDTRFYNAASGECFGDTGTHAANELTPFRPRSPYAVAKAAAYWEVANYRDAYDLFACSGILFNHESPLRPQRFVTRKITSAVARIARGSKETLELGSLNTRRDWGWAPDYVEAMWLMLQQQSADDFVIATGCTASLEDVLAYAFSHFDLNWRDHVRVDEQAYVRPTDIHEGRADPSKAQERLGWTATRKMPDVIGLMLAAEEAC